MMLLVVGGCIEHYYYYCYLTLQGCYWLIAADGRWKNFAMLMVGL